MTQRKQERVYTVRYRVLAVTSIHLLISLYSAYRGHDFPENLPLPGLDSIPLSGYTVEESDFYTAEGFPADNKWHELAGPSEGYIRLGPDPRIFAVTMFHQ